MCLKKLSSDNKLLIPTSGLMDNKLTCDRDVSGQCLHHGATFVPPFFLHNCVQVTTCSMASVRDMMITEALLALFLAYNVIKQNLKLRCYGFHVSNYGALVSHVKVFFFPILDSRDAFHAVLCLHCCVTDRT